MINSILINLPKRTDRLKHAVKELVKFFGESNCTAISKGVITESSTIAIREAHKNCVHLAKNSGFENVVIIEDDICFRDNSKAYFDELLNNLPIDYEVCLFGIYGGVITEIDNKYWNKLNKFSGCHFYLVNKTAYDKILNYNGTQPIDHWIGQNLNCYISKKHFAYQLDGYSDNAKTVTDYNNSNLKQYEKYFL